MKKTCVQVSSPERHMVGRLGFILTFSLVEKYKSFVLLCYFPGKNALKLFFFKSGGWDSIPGSVRNVINSVFENKHLFCAPLWRTVLNVVRPGACKCTKQN